jgi:hypothetical protein
MAVFLSTGEQELTVYEKTPGSIEPGVLQV